MLPTTLLRAAAALTRDGELKLSVFKFNGDKIF
jgi:hypothetical protein